MNFKSEKITIEENEYDLLIGKNALGNEEIIKMSNQDDTWFHFNEISGPHIILQNNGELIKKKSLYEIASKLFQLKPKAPINSSVMYTKVKYVSLTNVPGTVVPKKYKIIKF
jgi:predicted ribosome quality control (RQC) complex YloA/Tae2 family protein